MTTRDRDAAAAHLGLLKRPWRTAFIVYALALEVAIHWPRLQIGSGSPASDKTLHAIAFGGLTLLLWQTAWIKRLWLVAVIVVAWSSMDELSQQLEIFGRRASWHDIVANVCGILVVATWIWALGPVGARTNRMRLALDGAALDLVLGRWRSWWLAAGVFLVSAAPVVIFWGSIPGDARGGPSALAIVASVMITAALLVRPWRRAHRAIVDGMRCFRCGSSCAAATFDEVGAGSCGACSNDIDGLQWTVVPPPDARERLSIAWPAAVLGVVGLAGGFAMIFSVGPAYAAMLEDPQASQKALRIARFYGTMPHTLRAVIDATAVALLLAVAARLHRVRLARFYDRRTRCRRCGHDLRGATSTTCAECGATA